MNKVYQSGTVFRRNLSSNIQECKTVIVGPKREPQSDRKSRKRARAQKDFTQRKKKAKRRKGRLWTFSGLLLSPFDGLRTLRDREAT